MKFKAKITGSDALSKALAKIAGEGGEAVIAAAIDETNILIAADAQQNLRKNGSTASGKALNSVKVITARATASRIRGEVLVDANYAFYIEYGRRAGKYPPLQPILQWVRKIWLAGQSSVTRKRRSDTKSQKQQQVQIARAIQKSIGKKGTKGKPFLRPAFVANRDKFMGILHKKWVVYVRAQR